MSTRSRMTTRQKLLAFGPALLLIGITALTASGLSMVSGATAASSINVTGTVGSSLVTDPTVGDGGDCAAGTMDFGNAWAGAAVVRSGCSLTYSTNDPGGAHVTFVNANTGATAVFCNDPAGPGGRDCASGQVNNVTGTNQTIGVNSFGLGLVSSTGPANNDPGDGVGNTENGTPEASTPMWAEVPAAGGAELCRTASANGATPSVCTIALGVRGKGVGLQEAGVYSGTINFTAADNNA